MLAAEVANASPGGWTVLLAFVTILGSTVGAWLALRTKKITFDDRAGERASKAELIADAAARKAYETLLEGSQEYNRRLEDKLDKHGVTLVEYAGKIGALQSDVENLKQRAHEQDQVIGQLRAENAELRSKLTDALVAVTRNDLEIGTLTEKLRKSEQGIAEADLLNEQMQKRLKEAGVKC